jgi:hypothetical protein
VLRGTGECFEKQEHDFMTSIREEICGAKRQGRIRLYSWNRLSLVNFYISIKPILGFVFLYIIVLIKTIDLTICK